MAFSWFLRSLLAAAFALWIVPGLPLPIPVRFLIGALTLLLLPGAEIAKRMGESASRVDTLVAGLGIQLVLVSLVTVVTFHTGWNARGAVALVLVLSLVAMLWPVRAPGDATPSPSPRAFLNAGLVLAVLAAGAAACLYVAGVPFSGFFGEDFLALGYIRKLSTLAAIRPDNYMYKAPATLAYVYAPFHFWEAMMVSLSGLDPIVMYHRIRALWFIASLLIHIVLIGTLAGNRRAGYLGGIVLVLLTASTFGGIAYAWDLGVEAGQLAPLSHPADIAISVLAPLAVALAVALVLGEGERWLRMLTWLAPLVPCAVFLIHPREVLQYLAYVALLAAAVSLTGQMDRRRAISLGTLIGIPLLFSTIVSATVMQTADVKQFEEAAMRLWHERYGHVLSSVSSALFAPPIWESGGQPTDLQILWKFPGYALFVWLAPLGLAFRRSSAALWLALACLGFLALIRIPALAYIFVSATYSQALFSGEVYLYPVVYTLIALVIALGAERAVSRWGVRGIGAALGFGVTLAAMTVLAMRAGQQRLDLLLAGTLVSAAVALATRWIRGGSQVQSGTTRGRESWMVAATLAATIPLVMIGTGVRAHLIDSEDFIESHHLNGNERPSLPEFAYNQYQRTWTEPTEWTRRFDRTFSPDLFTIPPAIMGTLAALPGPTVVDGPFEETWLIEVHLFTSHYLVHSGTPYMLDQPYRATYVETDRPHPVFCAPDAFKAAQAIRYLAENRVRYLLIDPPHAFVSSALVPGVARVLLDDAASGWSILEIHSTP